MRQDVKILCIFNLSLLFVLFIKHWELITMFCNKQQYTAGALEVSEYESRSSAPQIPRIIHQTYKTAEIPEIWRETQASIALTNPDYEYILWTDEMARDFIAEHYPWFLDTFKSYKYAISRADAIRYFVLYHYGGVYIDLDNGIKQPLDNLLKYSTVFPMTDPSGVSNDIMASAPRHPLFARLINELQNYNRNWLLPYVTIMYSAGPLFLSLVLQKHLHYHSAENDPYRVRVLMPDAAENSHFVTIRQLFSMLEGCSWHQGDAQFFLMVERHLLPFVLLFVIAGCALLALIFFIQFELVFVAQRLTRNLYRRSYILFGRISKGDEKDPLNFP